MLIKVKVYPSSKKEEIIKKGDNEYQIKVKEKPENNKANEKVIEILSVYFKIASSKIVIIKGQKSRNKIIKIYTESPEGILKTNKNKK